MCTAERAASYKCHNSKVCSFVFLSLFSIADEEGASLLHHVEKRTAHAVVGCAMLDDVAQHVMLCRMYSENATEIYRFTYHTAL